jgi:hypothetical protein
MAKHVIKVRKVGFRAFINRTGEPGAKYWESVGYIFETKHLTEMFLKSQFPNVLQSRIVGVRVNIERTTRPIEREGASNDFRSR